MGSWLWYENLSLKHWISIYPAGFLEKQFLIYKKSVVLIKKIYTGKIKKANKSKNTAISQRYRNSVRSKGTEEIKVWAWMMTYHRLSWSQLTVTWYYSELFLNIIHTYLLLGYDVLLKEKVCNYADKIKLLAVKIKNLHLPPSFFPTS